MIARRTRLRAALALAGGAALILLGRLGGGAVASGEWVPVKRDDLVLGIDVTGTLKAVDSDQIGPPGLPDIWEYKIASMAPEGAEVKKGQPVLGFDTAELARRLEEKKAESDQAAKEIEQKEANLALGLRDAMLALAEAEARQRRAELKLEVPGEVAQDRELRQARLDLDLAGREIDFQRRRMEARERAARAELEALRDRRDRASGRVREIEDAIARMTVRAPRDGTVIYLTNRRGERKKVGDTAWRMDRLLEIPDLSRMRAEGEVGEADAGRLLAEQKVTIRLDAQPDVEFRGRVKAIRGTVERPTPESPLKVVRVDLELERTDTARMRPGMRFRGTIESARMGQVLVVPADAVFPTPEGPVAYRKTLFGVEKALLDLGQRSDRSIEVLAGLAEGDRVSRKNLAPGRGI